MYIDENRGEIWVGDKSTRNLELKREQWQSGNDGEEVLQVGHKYSRGIKLLVSVEGHSRHNSKLTGKSKIALASNHRSSSILSSLEKSSAA